MTKWHEFNDLEKDATLFRDKMIRERAPRFLVALMNWVIRQCRKGKQDIVDEHNGL